MTNPSKYPPPQLAPEQFELTVKNFLDAAGAGLTSFQTQHRERLAGIDGEYEIDVTCKFSVLGVDYLTLVECKHYRRLVGREKVQTLWAKVQSTGAHKGIIFATSGFQKGAVTFAKAHGIALIQLVDGRSSYLTRSFGLADMLSWDRVPASIERVVGWLITEIDHFSQVSTRHPEALASALGLNRSKRD